MVFDNPGALWLLPLLTLGLLVLGSAGWRARREIAGALGLAPVALRRRQVEKYVLAGLALSLLTGAMALPRLVTPYLVTGRSGQVALLVDDTASMAAQVDPASPNRLARTKAMLHDIVDQMQGLEGVQLSLFGMTEVARSLVPFVGPSDYAYLRTGIDKVLDINATPGEGTSLGQPVLDVADKFSPNAQARLIVLFSDGEVFQNDEPGLDSRETEDIQSAASAARRKGIKIITVGVGEALGARIPLRDAQGKFTGGYAQLDNTDFISYLDERGLKMLARDSGGQYYAEGDSQALINDIQANLAPFAGSGFAGSAFAGSGEQGRAGYPLAPWLVAAAVPFWVLLVRRHLRA